MREQKETMPHTIPKNKLSRIINRIATIGAKPGSSAEDLFKLRFLIFMGTVMSGGGLLWGSICLYYNLWLPAAIPYGYTVVTIINYTILRFTKNFQFSRAVQVAISLLLPFLFQWSLGGFVPSGGVMLWAMLGLVGSFSFKDFRFSVNVLLGYLVLTIITGVVDTKVRHYGIQVPLELSIIFFVLNICVISGCVFGLTFYLVRQKHEAEEYAKMDRLKSDFLSTVSHELRTPLTSILGFTAMIQKKLEKTILPKVVSDDKKTQKHIAQVQGNIKVILEEGKRLTNLINDVLDITKMESNAIEWRHEQLSIEDVIHHAEKATSSLLNDKKDLSIELTIKEPLWPVVGDMDRLIQVVINLLSNAVKFTEKGIIRIEGLNVEREDQRIVEVRVSDQGVGIAKDDLGHVFEKFKQVGDTLTGKPMGTGLGLPISKKIIEYHGGTIWVESRLGKGSCFAFQIPAADGSTAQAATAHTSTETAKGPRHVFGNGRILIADDDPAICEFLGQALTDLGYSITICSDGETTLKRAKQEHPDLLILDVLMPKLSGFDVVKALKANPETAEIPAIAISAADELLHHTESGVARCFSKPIQFDSLKEAVENLLQPRNQKNISTVSKAFSVLVVDDDSQIRQMLSQDLSEAGYQVYQSSDGKDAVEITRKRHPDLVILDVVMPGIDGFDVAAILKNDPTTRNIPIVILSVIEDKARAKTLGVDSYLSKPVDLGHLQQEIAALLPKNGRGQPKQNKTVIH